MNDTYERADLTIAYIGGGSMNWAWETIGDLALEPKLSGLVKLYDTDENAAKANAVIGNGIADDPAAVGKWKYEAAGTLAGALKGADFVIISILPGTFKEMASDVHTPEKYGIYQSVGDTTGPGGVLRSMRAAPMFAEIGEAVKAYAPNAWLINYTNPMSVCTAALYSVFPGVKAFGCCHEVFHSQKLLAKMAETEYGIPKIEKNEIKINVSGINHFTWLTNASYKTRDLMPVFKKYAREYAKTGYKLADSDADETNFFRNMNRVCFDLFNRYGAVPCAGDRHIAEFMPPWYLHSPDAALKWGFALTPVHMRIKARQKKLEQSARIVAGDEKFNIKRSGEEGTEQIKALLGLSELSTNVSAPNAGQAEGLPMGAVVETNAVFGLNAVRPVFAGRLPEPVSRIVYERAANQMMLTDACIKKDIGLAFSAFLNDSLVTIGVKEAEELFSEMVENTKEYLPGWKL